MADVTIIEETLARLASYNVKAAIIQTHDGIPIRSTLSTPDQQNANPSLAPKLANLSARLFHIASTAARTVTTVRTTKDLGGKDKKLKDPRIGSMGSGGNGGNTVVVDSVRIRTVSGGVPTELIIMNAEKSGNPPATSNPNEPPLLVTVIQDCA